MDGQMENRRPISHLAKAGATKMREAGKNIGIFDILTFEILMKH